MPTRYHLLIVATLLVTLPACASAPRIGVRAGFETHRVHQIAIAPIWSDSRFGVPADEWRQVEAIAIRNITAELNALGFVTLDPAALRDVLERSRAWEKFGDILDFGTGLEKRFEPSVYAPATGEVLALRELAAENVLGVGSILFTEIVYHSRGTCTTDARDHSRFAVVVSRDGAANQGRGPTACVVTHIQAKLVDVKTAQTMWHNRVLREFRAAEVSLHDDLDNVRHTAHDVVAGAHGLAPFAPTLATSTLTD